MASERRAQVVRLAEILGIEFERSLGTAELMEMCVVECDGRSANWGQEADETESEDEAPPPGMRQALRSLPPAAAPAPASSTAKHRAGGNGARKLRKAAERFESEKSQRFDRERPVTGSVRASNGATLHGVGIVPPVRHGASFHSQADGRILEVPDGVTLDQAHEALGLLPPRRRPVVDVDVDEDDAAEDCPEDATDEGGIEPVVRHTRREKRRGGKAA